MHTFFSAKTDTGAAGAVEFGGDIMTLAVFGTWDGGGAQFEASVDGTNYVAIPDAAFTADGVVNVELAPRAYIRCNVTSVGASTSITAQAERKGKVGVS
jgi:hypothetical protein